MNTVSTYRWSFWVLFLVVTVTRSAFSPSNSFFANTTSFSSSTIASSSRPSVNTSCSSCVIAADAEGLQQIFWLTQTLSVTLDTVHVTVTSYNGSNATAVTNSRTVSGDVQALANSSLSYVTTLIESIFSGEEGEGYFNSKPTFVRGTDGQVGTTSIPYGQPYAQVTAINYRYMTPISDCPLNMGKLSYGESTSACVCLMNTWFPQFPGASGADSATSEYTLDATYYQPFPASVLNEGNSGDIFDAGDFQPWDGKRFKAWLAGNEAFKAAYPNWEDCAFWDAAAGPPGVKMPVAALTATVATTVHSVLPSSVAPMPLLQPTYPPLPKSTAVPVSPQPSDSSSAGYSGGSTSGGSSTSVPQPSAGSSKGSGNSDSQAYQGGNGPSTTTSNAGNTGSGGDTGPKGGGESGNSGYTESSGYAGPQGIGGPSTTSGNNENGGPSVTPGSQGGGGSSGRQTGSNTQGNEGTRNSESAGYAYKPTQVFTLASHTFTATNPTEVQLGGSTLTAGGSAVTVFGTPISLGSSGLVIASSTYDVPVGGPSTNPDLLPSTTVIGAETYTIKSDAVAVDGTTLSRGASAITVHGTPISLGSSGLVVASSTYAMPVDSPSPNPNLLPSTTVIGAETFEMKGTAVAVDGTTLSEGASAINVHGTPISLGSSGLVVAGSTIPVLGGGYTAASETSGGLGSIILAGFGPSTTTTAGTSATGSESASIVVYTTTDSKGSTYVTSSTSTLSGPSPSTSVVVYSTTDSKGSTYVTSSTSTLSAPPLSTSVTVYSTTNSLGSTHVTSTTSTAGASTPSVEAFKGAAARTRLWGPTARLLGSILTGGWVLWS